MCIKSHAYARAGLLGNPSDGYHGKTISISVRNFTASVSLYQTQELKIESREQDSDVYRNISDLVERTNLYGYYGGVRLIKAAIKTFFNYCESENIKLEAENFTIRYNSTIPRQVGLGGSSAIITAVMRALMKFYEVEIPLQILPSIILDSEVKELGINAGLQDRVIQVFEGCMYMNFDSGIMKKNGYGEYERLDTSLLPHLFIAYKTDWGKVSGHALNDIRIRFERGDKLVIDSLKSIAELAEEGKQTLLKGNVDRLNDLINENFNLRKKIQTISENNYELIKTARACGASAKFAGSGGSIIGIYKNEETFDRLTLELDKIQAKVIKPEIE